MMKKTTKAMKITTKTTKMTKAGIENNDNAQPVHRQGRERQARPRAQGAQQRPPGHACHHLLCARGVPDQGVGSLRTLRSSSSRCSREDKHGWKPAYRVEATRTFSRGVASAELLFLVVHSFLCACAWQ